MGNRTRCKKSIEHLFDHYIVLEQRWPPKTSHSSTPSIKFTFPPIVTDKEKDMIERAQKFAFPTDEKILSIENFCFVLTNGDGEWTFGYCRQQPSSSSNEQSQECLIMISSIPYWNTTFYKLLNYCVWISNWPDVHETFLTNLYQTSVVQSALEHGAISVQSKTSLPPFISTCPNSNELPSTLDNRCLAEFYNSLSIDSMITLFASLLSERRIFITSSKLSRLTSIVMACNLILYPMCWQHVLIPVLPSTLSDYLETPFPAIVGVPVQTWNNKGLISRQSHPALADIIHVDADTNKISSPFPEDILELPNDIIAFLKSNLKVVEQIGADGLAKIFLHTFVRLMGHVENALVIDKNELKLDQDNFLHLAKSSHRRFIKLKLLHTQMFHQFIDEMISNIKSGKGKSGDVFYQEINSVIASGKKSGSLQRYKAVDKVRKTSMSGALSMSTINISSPMPITPDLIRFNETLPRTKPVNKNYFTTSSMECLNEKPEGINKASIPSLKFGGKQQTLNPSWDNSWKHVINDFQDKNALSLTNGSMHNTNTKMNDDDGTRSSVVIPNPDNTIVKQTLNSTTATPLKFVSSTSPNSKSTTNTTHALLVETQEKQTKQDLITFDNDTRLNKQNELSGKDKLNESIKSTTSLEANIKENEDLLREYGLYDFYRTS